MCIARSINVAIVTHILLRSYTIKTVKVYSQKSIDNICYNTLMLLCTKVSSKRVTVNIVHIKVSKRGYSEHSTY